MESNIIKLDTSNMQLSQGGEDNHFPRTKIGKTLIEKYHCVMIDDNIHIYDNGIYSKDKKVIKKWLYDNYVYISRKQIADVMDYVETNAPEMTEANYNYIAFKNGYIDIRDFKFYEHSPEVIFTSTLNIDYDTTAKSSEIMDDMLEKVSHYKEDHKKLIIEVIAYSLIRTNKLGKMFMVAGEPGCGKSTLLNTIQALFGSENTSNVSLKGLEYQFSVSAIFQKMLNIGDDIEATTIRDVGNLKKLVTGEPVHCSFKGQDEFSFINYATLIFGANTVPRFTDTNGITDRLVIIPLTNRIRDTKTDDKFFGEKLETQDNLAYLVNIALPVLKSLMESGRFTIPESVKQHNKDFEETNNPVTQWAEEHGVIISTRDASYQNYNQWCKDNGFTKPLSSPAFVKELNKQGFVQARITENGQRIVYLLKLETKDGVELSEEQKHSVRLKSTSPDNEMIYTSLDDDRSIRAFDILEEYQSEYNDNGYFDFNKRYDR